MRAAAGEEPRCLGPDVLVRAGLGHANAAEPWRVDEGVVEVVVDRCAATDGGIHTTPADELELALGVQGFDEEVVGHDAGVVHVPGRVRQLAPRGERAPIGRRSPRVIVVGFLEIAVDVAEGHAVVGGDGAGNLGLETGLGLGSRERLAVPRRDEDLAGIGAFLIAAGGEEPQFVAHDVTAEGGLVDVVVRVLLAGGERGLTIPALVGHVDAEGARELVATRLAHRVDDATREAAVLGRRAAGDGRGLENRILDEQFVRVPAQVLVEHHAVQGVEALPGCRSRDRDVAVGSGTGGPGIQQHR